jgi:ribosomal protein L37E
MSIKISAQERDRRRRQIVIKDRSVCYHCKQEDLKVEDKFCHMCGFPQNGSEQEQRMFIINNRRKKSEIKEAKTMVTRGRNFLFIVAGLNMLSFIGGGTTVLIIGLIISAVYLGLGVWASSKPFPALLTGLIFYITLNLFFGILDVSYLLSGLIWKIAVIGSLTFALYSVKDIEKLQQEIAK